MAQLLKVQNFMVSSDGFGAGEGQSLEQPFGHADPRRLISWAGATASWPNRTDPAARAASTTTSPATSPTTSAPRSWAATSSVRSVARGRRRVEGLVGRHPAVPHAGVRAHAPPAPVVHAVGHDVPLPRRHPEEALRQAKEAADGKDVRLGGGVATVREFLDADLVDTMHVAVAPIELGRGERLWASPDELLDRFHLDAVPSPAASPTCSSGADLVRGLSSSAPAS